MPVSIAFTLLVIIGITVRVPSVPSATISCDVDQVRLNQHCIDITVIPYMLVNVQLYQHTPCSFLNKLLYLQNFFMKESGALLEEKKIIILLYMQTLPLRADSLDLLDTLNGQIITM